MSTANFTKGLAWIVSKSPSHNGFRVSNPTPEVVGIDISVFAPYGAKEKKWQARAFEIAHKVAAAEQMFEALKRIRDGKEVPDPDNPGSTIVVSLPGDEIDHICAAALAAAVGEA